MRTWPYILFASVLSAVYLILFFLPGHMASLALIPAKVGSGEFWRFLTYPFVHLDTGHLVKNLFGFALVTLGIVELKTKLSDFSSIYLLAGFLAVLPLWFIFQFTALGASVAIYSAFGLIALESKKYEIKPWHLILVTLALIFADALVSKTSASTMSAFSHISGLLFGLFAFSFSFKVHKFFEKKKSFCLRRI